MIKLYFSREGYEALDALSSHLGFSSLPSLLETALFMLHDYQETRLKGGRWGQLVDRIYHPYTLDELSRTFGDPFLPKDTPCNVEFVLDTEAESLRSNIGYDGSPHEIFCDAIRLLLLFADSSKKHDFIWVRPFANSYEMSAYQLNPQVLGFQGKFIPK